jgi:hypothetical protein
MVAIPMYGFLGDWNHTWNLAPKSENTKLIIKALINMPDFASLLLNLLLFAVVQSIAMGVFFRVVLQKLLVQIMRRTPLIAIIITSAFFSIFFFDLRDFMPRLLLGLQVGIIYYLTANLWLSVLGHAIASTISIVSFYLYQAGMVNYNPLDPTGMTWYSAVISLIITVFLFGYLRKESPLPIIIQEDESDVNSIGA